MSRFRSDRKIYFGLKKTLTNQRFFSNKKKRVNEKVKRIKQEYYCLKMNKSLFDKEQFKRKSSIKDRKSKKILEHSIYKLLMHKHVQTAVQVEHKCNSQIIHNFLALEQCRFLIEEHENFWEIQNKCMRSVIAFSLCVPKIWHCKSKSI